MNSDRNYGGVIWTTHVLERIAERGFSQELAWQTFKTPDSSYAGKQSGTIESIKRYNSQLITVISKQNEKGEWVILSSWIDPPLPGTKDYKKKEDYKKFQKATFWGKMWLTLKQQLGF